MDRSRIRPSRISQDSPASGFAGDPQPEIARFSRIAELAAS
jgi:hypothetical protein